MALPKNVIKQDHDLEAEYESLGSQLMEHRWHWTLDTANPGRVSLREYAREVDRHVTVIRADANGWAEMLADQSVDRTVYTPAAKTPNDYRKRAKLGAEKKHAADAIAKATGRSLGAVVDNSSQEINAVVERARTRADECGTTVEEEIDRAAEWDAKARAAEAKNREERKSRHTARFIEIEADLGVAMQRLRKVLNTAQDVGFDDEEIEMIGETLSKLRALMGLIDLRITGETAIDWDAEAQKLTT